jgi:hypothetical protein
VRAVQDFHMDSRGWNDIAYSFIINHAGDIYEGRGAGVAGGHTAGHNTTSHAVCVLGNFDQAEPTQAALDSVVALARHGHAEGWWPQTFTGGHRNASGAATSCPGSHLYARLPEINSRLLEDDMTPEEVRKIIREELDRPVSTGSTFRGIQEAVLLAPVGRSGRNIAQHLQDIWAKVKNG